MVKLCKNKKLYRSIIIYLAEENNIDLLIFKKLIKIDKKTIYIEVFQDLNSNKI